MQNWTLTKISILKVCSRPAGNLSLIILLWLPVSLMAGCSSEEKVPTDIISEAKMSDVLTEIHIAEARISKLQLRSIDSSIILFNKIKDDIWKKYKMDSLSYQTSYDYYVTHPKQMKTIYSKVTENLEKREKSKNIKLTR